MKASLDVKGFKLIDTQKMYFHNLRKTEELDKPLYQIDGVDRSKSHLNVNHININNLEKYFHDKKDTLNVRNVQKTSNLFSSGVIHAGNVDECLGKEEAIKFLLKSKDGIEKNYGEIMMWSIHLDEATPHIHVITSNLKKVGDKYFGSSKAACNMQGLSKSEVREVFSQMHDTFHAEVSSEFGFTRNQKGGPKGFARQEDYIANKASLRKEEALKALNNANKSVLQKSRAFAKAIEANINMLMKDKSKRSLGASAESLKMEWHAIKRKESFPSREELLTTLVKLHSDVIKVANKYTQLDKMITPEFPR